MRKVLRNKWKRVCSLVLAAAMAVTMFPATNAQAAAKPEMETVELVQNGDFEGGNDGWAGYSGGTIENVVTTENGRENHILRVKDRANTSASAMYDLSGKLTKGTTYRIKGRIKYTTGVEKKAFNVMFQNCPDDLGEHPSNEYRPCVGTVQAKKGEWKDFDFSYEAKDHYLWGNPQNLRPFGTAQNFFFIETEWKASTTKEEDLMDYYLDDISITYEKVKGEEPEVPEVVDLISNGSFEKTPIDKNWTGMGIAAENIERVEGVAHGDGNASLKVKGYTAAWQGVRYNLTDLLANGELAAGNKYTLTAWVKGNSGSAKMVATIKGKIGGKDSYVNFSDLTDVNSTDWTKITKEITLLDYDKDELFVYWHWESDKGVPTEFYIDDVTLTTPSDNIIRNGSFERSLEKWTAYGAAEGTDMIADATDDYHTGNHSVKVTNRTKTENGPAQDVGTKLRAGNYYTVSAWVKYNEGPATKNFNLTLQHGDANTRTLLTSGTVAKGEWTKIEAICGMPSRMDAVSNILFVETPFVAEPDAANDLMDFYVDDVSVTPYVDETQTLAKKFGYGNPITTHEFGADPYAIEYDGRIYVYMTADDYEFSDKDNPYSNNFGYITSLRVVSSADLMNWTDHGEIEVAGQNGGKGPAIWASHSWAPAIAHKVIDGKDKFFLYFANDASGIGVLTSDTPVGPWTDPTVDAENPKGHALITKATPGCSGVEWCFDPAVLVDGDNAYIYFGGGVPNGKAEHPMTARVAKLGADMVSIEGEAKTIDAPWMFEDSGIFKFGDTYYYSYCSNFLSREGYEDAPAGGTICYMTSKNPMEGFTYQGEIFSNPQVWFGVGGNNHHATFVFKDKSYFIYHAQTVSKALGVERGYRSTHIDEIELDEEGKIVPISGTYEGIPQLAAMDPYKRIEAETIAWNAGVKASATGRKGSLFEGNNLVLTDLQEGDWTAVSQLDFGSTGADKITVSVGSKDGGTIEIRAGYPEGKKIGEIDVPEGKNNHTYQLITADIEKLTGVQNIFLIFHQKKEGATTAVYQAELQSLWEVVKSAEGSLPLKEQLNRQLTKAHNVSSGLANYGSEKPIKEALEAAIETARGVANNGSATNEQLSAAITALNTAIDTADTYPETGKLLKEKLKYRIKFAEQLVELQSLTDAAKKAALQAAIDSAKQLLRDDSIMNVDYYQFTEEGGTPPTEGEKTNKDLLGEEITAAKALLDELSGAKKTALEAVIAEVEEVFSDDNASEADITAARNKLDAAVEEAQKPEAVSVKTQLQKKILEAKNMLNALSDAKKAALNAAITTAEGIYNTATATDEQLQDALDDLNTAIEEAKKPDVTPGKTPKEQLDEKIKEAKGMLASLSDAKKAALNAAITTAEGIYNTATATDEQLQDALDDLNTAIEEAKKPDVTPGKTPKEQLGEKIDAAKEMLEGLSADKKAALQAVITEVEGIFNNADATEKQLTDALDKLNKAIEDAGKADEEKPVKEQLDDKIKAAKDMLAGLSETKKAALQAVITEVEGVLNNASASEADIQAALDKLDKAIEDAGKTEEKPQDKPELNQTFTETSGLTYRVISYSGGVNNVAVTGADRQLAGIVIPDTVSYKNETFAVTEIGESAFANQAGLTSVTIGKNVTAIGAKAFQNAKKLKKITFQGTAVKTIGKDAFKGIDKKASFTMSKAFTNKNLKYKITKNTVSAKEVTVTGSTSKKLASVSVPATVKFNGMSFKVTVVGKKAFRKQAKLKSATIGKNVKKIEASAFDGCKKLAKVKFSGTAIKTIGKNAFKGIKKNAKFSVKKSKKSDYRKLLKKAKTKNFKI